MPTETAASQRSANLTDVFPSRQLESNGRTVVQLTAGADFCYPLYYFIDSITADGRYLLYHRETPGEPHEIQLHRLDLRTGESTPLTRSTAPDAHWQPWGVDPAIGVKGDRSALAPQRGLAVYFDGQQARAIDLHTLEDRTLFDVPDDRFVLSQNCFTGDEQWFVYIDVDRALFKQWLDSGRDRGEAHMCRGTAMRAFHVDTGEHRTLFRLNYPVHHVHPVGMRGLAFSHVPGDLHGLGLAHVDRPDYRIARPQDAEGRCIIHHVPTATGIAYELLNDESGRLAGILDPETGDRIEFPVPTEANHTGCDPLGRLMFYQCANRIRAMAEYDPAGEHRWVDVCDRWKMHGKGQKAHLHPRLVLGRRWLQMVGGDPKTETNHIFLIDVSDLDRTENLPWPRAGACAAALR